jgi:hypothetical protein
MIGGHAQARSTVLNVAESGGLFNDGSSPFGTPDVTLLACKVLLNQADVGAAGVGGGVYNLRTFGFDDATLIALNQTATSNYNIFP